MVQVSNYTQQHTRLREIIEDRLNQIRNEFGGLGGHRTRLEEVWNGEYRPMIREFDEGFSLHGAGSTTENPERTFDPREVPLDCQFSEIVPHIIPFINQIQHKILNAANEGEYLDYHNHPNGLKAIVYGGFALGRGLTLSGMVCAYFARRPGDQGVAMQLQRWCGYRSVPGENTLDLVRLFIPPTLSEGYSQMLSTELSNRHRLSFYRREGLSPAEVGPRLMETPGFRLVSQAKRGRMTTTMNVYKGKIITQTTYLHDQSGVDMNVQNWTFVQNKITEWLENQSVNTQQHVVLDDSIGDQGVLLRNLRHTDVLDILENWQYSSHERENFSPPKMISYIRRASNIHHQLTRWSLYFPSRMGSTPVELGFIAADSGEMSEYSESHSLVQLSANLQPLLPFARSINNSRIGNDNRRRCRFGTVADPSWRTIDLPDGVSRSPEEGLLIIAPIIHPFNLVEPGIIGLSNSERIYESDEGSGQWPTLPSLMVVFPLESDINQAELVHEQFVSNEVTDNA